MLDLLRTELLKLRRSLALWMMALIPLSVVLFMTLLHARDGLGGFNPKTWYGLSGGILALWCYFMLPLYTALATALINGQEHRQHTWRLMLTLPLSPAQWYLAKLLTGWLLVLGATVGLWVWHELAVRGLIWLGAPAAGAWPMPLHELLPRTLLASLPVLVFQHHLAWRYPSIVVPLSAGVMSTMGVMQIASSQHWVWYPWSYALMAAQGSASHRRDLALLLGAAVGLVALMIALWSQQRRECPH